VSIYKLDSWDSIFSRGTRSFPCFATTAMVHPSPMESVTFWAYHSWNSNLSLPTNTQLVQKREET